VFVIVMIMISLRGCTNF